MFFFCPHREPVFNNDSSRRLSRLKFLFWAIFGIFRGKVEYLAMHYHVITCLFFITKIVRGAN